MRRSLLGLLTVVAIAGLLLTAGCHRSGVLTVVSINRGNTLQSDIADFYQYFDKIDSDYVTLYQYASDSVEVVLEYVEVGAGLPSYTPYKAVINSAKVSFKSKLSPNDEPPAYSPVTVSMNQTVTADPTGKTKTTFYMTPIPGAWKQKTLGEFFIEPPDYDIIDLADATVLFSGYDSIAGLSVSASGTFQVEFGNFFDDLNRFGK